MSKKKSPTNDTTNNVLKFFFGARIPAWRSNVLPVPMVRKGTLVGFRPGGKAGLLDISGVIPPQILPARRLVYGIALYVEVKTGRDRLRPEQIGFIHTVTGAGAVCFVIKDFEDFKAQWSEFIAKNNVKTSTE